jgi:UDP:flavonoid glycosyltransferase YjiC (YdhE family)
LKVLCVPSAVGFAHLGRLLLIAGALGERGHEVTFAYGGPDAGEIAAAGHAHADVHDVAVGDPTDNAYAAWSDADVELALESLGDAIAATGAEAVVADFHPLATIASERAGVPSAGVVPFELAPGFDADAVLFGGGSRRRLARRAARGVFRVRSHGLAAPFAAAARSLGLSPRETLADVFRGDATLVAELEGFAPELRPFPGQQITGPLVWEETAGDVLKPPPDGIDRVYATIGNTGRRELLELAARALGGAPAIQLVMTSGRYTDPPPPGALNVRSYARLRGSQVMRHSRLAIHCGGRGTTYQALAAGIPSIVVPYVSGQESTARLVTRHGVGVGFEPAKLDERRLAVAVRHLLDDDGARGRAQEFQRRLVGVDGPGTAATAVEALARPR